ncbi:alpha/beta hydrolase [Modestobacter sp. SSW1-42]|uniref:alpha/beta hydrolase n=1 Tax=Modestobacter sp. SSW1-42 TaxID=596372 RepID=UPI00398579AB
MTAPLTTPLTTLADWDLPLLRGCVGTLDLVAERLLPWRYRLDDLGRRLGDAECWSGPAGTAAAAALVELSTVAGAVTGAVAGSLHDLQGLTGAAAEAQERAERARALAASAGIGLDAAGHAVGVPPAHAAMSPDQAADVAAGARAAGWAEAAAEDALAAAARAGECARAAAGPLAVLGVVAAPVSFADLVTRLPGTSVPQVPAGGDPQAVASWWTSLSAAAQQAVIAAQPGAVGALDGLPGWARDQANRLGLATASQHLPPGSPGAATARAVQAQLAEVEAAGAVAQLLQFDPAGDLVALAVGDVDTAAAVGVLVPGIETTPADDLPGLVGDARDVATVAAAAAPGLAVATVAWLGYRTPGWRTAWSPGAAVRGGPALDRALDGLAAARTAPPAVVRAAPPRTTVLAHSYGTVVTGQAVRAPGRLAADAVVLLGSPGVPGGGADDLEAAEVYGAWSPADPVSLLDWFGDTPADRSFGDVDLPTDPTQWHTRYYDRDRPTLAAIGEVVAGTRPPG